MTRPWIYVAGPYTKPDPTINTRNALLTGTALWKAGAMPIVPHLTHLWHLVDPHEYEHWMAYNHELLTRCDALLRLPGKSPGADREMKTARSALIPCLLSMKELAEWITMWKVNDIEDRLF